MDDGHKAHRQNDRLQDLDQKKDHCLAQHDRRQADPDRGLAQDDLALLTDLTVGVERAHKGRHRRQNKKRRAAADVDKVGGKAVGVGCQLDDQHHKRRLQRQTGEQQLVVPDQLQVALHQHAKLAQEFQDFYWLHRLSASCAASGQAASRRLNSGVVKYFLR